MTKRLLTLEDLYEYYSSNVKSSHFSAKDDSKEIVVQVPGRINFESNNDTEGLIPVHLQACHTLNNLNKTFISEESMNNALSSFANRPILGFIHEVDGQSEFYTHNMHQDEDGELIYDEYPVGVIPESNNAQMVYDAEKGHKYLEIDGYIYEEYSKAAEILEREEGCSCSVELSIREMSYNAKEKLLNLEDFYFTGVTILGKDEEGNEIKPGMSGSEIKLSDFRAKYNSMFAQENVIARLEELEKKFNDLSINNNSGKEDGTVTKFEELLEKYSKTIEDINFDYEGLSDEELEAAFEKAFAKGDEPEDDIDVEDDAKPEGKCKCKCNPDDNKDGNKDCNECGGKKDKFVKSFELSHDDIRCALYGLIAQFEEEDNDWYSICNVYDTHFVYFGMISSQYYGQEYRKCGDKVELNGDRYALFAEFLTESEKAEVELMRKRCCELEESAEKLAKYEAEPEKMNILNSSDYGYVVDTEEFINLKNQDVHFDLSIEEVKAQADEILMKYAKSGALNSRKNPEVNEAAKKLFISPKESTRRSRYGNMFNK